MTDNAVVAEGLVKHFGDVHALDGIDLTVARGQVVGLLGPNGAGKTTTVRILSTLLQPTAGRAEVAGFDVVRQPDQVRRAIGLTGQYAAVDEYLTGRENLRMFGDLYHLSPRYVKERSAELLEWFELTEAADRPAKTYSGGMRRRLDLAASLVAQPSILFLDEPTTGLDPQARLEVWRTVREVAAGGTTVVLTTQYLDEAEQLADRIAILHGGRIIVDGTLAELRQLLPPATVEYVERQPTLEEIFLAVVGDARAEGGASR